MTYKTVLKYEKGYRKRTTHTGLTLQEAQEICKDKESSSLTCTKSYLKRRTKLMGNWFIIYTEE